MLHSSSALNSAIGRAQGEITVELRRSFVGCVWSWCIAAMVTVIAQPQVAQAVTCSALTPDPSPAVNRSNIQACLTGGNATLTSGTFNVDSGITVGSNQILIGPTNPATWPTIKLATGNTSNFLVRFDGSNSRVAFLTLDGNNAFGNYANSSVVTFLSGGYNQLDNSHVMNAQLPTAGKKSTAST